MSPAFRRVKTLSRAHTRIRAHLRLSSFSFFAFTSSPTLRKTLTDCTIRVKAWGVKTGTFRAKSGDHRPITPLFSTDLPSPRRKITFTRLFSVSKLGNGHLAQGKASEARKRRPYTTVIQVLNQHKCLSNLSRCAAIFRSSYQPFHRTALRKTRQRRQARGVKVKTQKSSPLTHSGTRNCTRWVKE